jgi:dGTPase
MADDLTTRREATLLAPYAMHSADSGGRRHAEPRHPYRGPYQRDRDRIVHTAAFRRLSHKTQVFMGDMGDYHRTRLTHTLEVASVARTIARVLRLNEDLVEALAVAHDLGHPPFGHSGEDVLDECLRDHGGFNHNKQALRICELLESRYPQFPGLNLTQEVLDGQGHRALKAPPGAREPSPLLEAQVVDAADSIAYDAHDADDALELGLIGLDQLLEVPLWREARDRVAARFGNLDDKQLRRAVVHELIDWQVGDVLAVAERERLRHSINSVADVRRAGILVRSSLELSEKKRELEQFLFHNVYRHPQVLVQRQAAQLVLRKMFAKFVSNPRLLPEKFARFAASEGVPRSVADYLAGMTDRFAFEQYQQLVGA